MGHFCRLIKGSSLCAVLPAVYAVTKDEPEPVTRPPPMRPSELPIYDSPHANYANYLEAKKDIDAKPGIIQSVLETPVKAIRTQSQELIRQAETVTGCAKESLEETLNKGSWIVNYLREEAHKEQRYGAVAMGGLTGFIFALRGGIIRKVVFTGTGTLVMGYICFPEETTKVVCNAVEKSEHYANVAWNFVVGVKPGDSPSESKLPAVPTNFDEMKALLEKACASIKEVITPSKKD